jgi:hypothetical protein
MSSIQKALALIEDLEVDAVRALVDHIDSACVDDGSAEIFTSKMTGQAKVSSCRQLFAWMDNDGSVGGRRELGSPRPARRDRQV